MKYRTGTLYNQKYAVLFKLSTSQTCPLCPYVNIALHILSGCQHTQIRNMITERHNIACRMILKAISKTGSLGSCIVSINIGSNERMIMQNLQIPETAESRIVPQWLFPPRFPDKDRFTSSRPHCVLVTPIAAITQKQQTNVGGWVLRSAGDNRGRLGASRQHRQPPVEPPTPDSTDPKTSANIGVTSTSSRSSTVRTPDLRTSWAPRRDCTNAPAPSFKKPLIPSIPSFWDWWHYLQHSHSEAFQGSGSWELASKLHVHSVNFAAKLVHTRRALSSTVINTHQEPVSGQACNPLDPHWFFLPFRGGGALRYLVPKWLLSLHYCGDGFHCLRSFFFFSFFMGGQQCYGTQPPWPTYIFNCL